MKGGEFVDIYSGSEVRVIMLKGLLEEKGIDSVVQNEYLSGITSGMGGGAVNTVKLKVHEDDSENAKSVVEDFIKNQH
jgi:hypothetical protein